jgi:tRNA pseudouridine38-40 synthase
MDDPALESLRRLKLIIEYDGTDFVGWQSQAAGAGRTVQQTIQEAFNIFTGFDAQVIGSGRTDSGVHARGQAAHAIVKTVFDCEKILRALNGILPHDIAILSVTEVDESFHARYNAIERRYSYTISVVPCAIDRKIAWYVRFPLDESAMNECCTYIIGEHDFRAFTNSQAEVHHHRCTIINANWERRENKLIFRVHANRFLHNMVRALVGTMVEVGRGYYSVEQFRTALTLGDRKYAGPTAPPVGLILEEVVYSNG